MTKLRMVCYFKVTHATRTTICYSYVYSKSAVERCLYNIPKHKFIIKNKITFI